MKRINAVFCRLLFAVVFGSLIGKAATAQFNVLVEIDSGEGFSLLHDIGTVSTGTVLSLPEDDYLNGDSAPNHVSFDSGRQAAEMVAGSTLRIRWEVPANSNTQGWIFGLDNVALNLFTGNMVGDFDNDGSLTSADIDRLIEAIAAPLLDAHFDLNNDGQVDQNDLSKWVKDLKDTWIGDANLDGEFNSTDFISVFQAGTYELDIDASWTEGDWNADKKFDSGDVIVAFQDGGFERGPREATRAVPEPSGCFSLVMLVILALKKFRSTLASTRLGRVLDRPASPSLGEAVYHCEILPVS